MNDESGNHGGNPDTPLQMSEKKHHLLTDKPSVLDDLIRKHAFQSPTKAALFFEDEAISYGEFYEDVCTAARMLLGFGIGHGDRVGYMFPNRPEILYLYFACFQIGAIAVPVNTRYQEQEIEYALLRIIPVSYHDTVSLHDDFTLFTHSQAQRSNSLSFLSYRKCPYSGCHS